MIQAHVRVSWISFYEGEESPPKGEEESPYDEILIQKFKIIAQKFILGFVYV